MRIEHRDLTLTYPRAIRDDKRRLVLDWLLEFPCSSIERLAWRLGLLGGVPVSRDRASTGSRQRPHT